LSKLTFEQLADLKLLVSVEGVGPAKIRNLLRKFKSIELILSAPTRQLTEVEGIGPGLALKIQSIKKYRATIEQKLEKTLRRLEKLNGGLITVWDKEFPPLLKKIDDPPMIIYYLGSFIENEALSIGIVGTRTPSSYGKIQTEKLTAELADRGVTIVSGLARGIDSVAHETAIKNNARTIAVIGSGIDVIYPPENKSLFRKIADSGLIISEYEPGTKPDALNFPKRNRIISGVSHGCVIVETGIKGGALYTARFALNQNREVFAVPGNLGIKQAEGTNLLIQKGEAKLITAADDILVELEQVKKSFEKGGKPKERPKDLNIFEEKIVGCIEVEPQHIDKIAEITGLSTSDCLIHLLSLEFNGIVKQLPGKVFAKL
jgi:DNA processing protein